MSIKLTFRALALRQSECVVNRAGLFGSGLTLTQLIKIEPNYKFFLYTNVFHCFCLVYFVITLERRRNAPFNTLFQKTNEHCQ